MRITMETNTITFDRALAERRQQTAEDMAEGSAHLAQLRAAGSGTQADEATTHRSEAPHARVSRAPAIKATTKAESSDLADVEARAKALESVLNRYRKVKDQFFFKDQSNTPAFRDTGEKLSTSHDDEAVAHSMVDLAKAKGWDCLKVSGSVEFKSAVWIYARAQGIDVAGHRPSELDKLKLTELQEDVSRAIDQPDAKRRTPPVEATKPAVAAANTHFTDSDASSAIKGEAGSMPASDAEKANPQRSLDLPGAETPPPLSLRHAAALAAMEQSLRRTHHTDAQVSAALQEARKQWTTDRVYVGRAVEHGAAPYDFNPRNAGSYYVRLEDPNGGRFLLWGLDFPRALAEAKAVDGDDLVVAYRGAVAVQVPVKIVSPDGQKIGYETVDRNAWNVTPVRTLAPEALATAKKQAQRRQGPDLELARQMLRTHVPQYPPTISVVR